VKVVPASPVWVAGVAEMVKSSPPTVTMIGEAVLLPVKFVSPL